jgi:uncharacterized membrane protein HdeD (DUF308 family)
MITFGYKNKFSGFIRALLAIAIGIVMVVSKTNALELAVQIIAAFLIATGVVTFFIGLKSSRGGEKNLFSVNAFVDVLLGALLFSFPNVVVNVLIYIIGFVLLLFGLFQILALVSTLKVYKLRIFAFIMPILVVVAGAFLIARPSFVGEAIGLIAGVSLILYGVSEIFSTFKMRKAIDEFEANQEDVDEQ